MPVTGSPGVHVTAGRVASRVDLHYELTSGFDDRRMAQARQVLCAEERERAARLKVERTRRDFVAAHALLRRALSMHGDLAPEAWRFDRGASGKPTISSGQDGEAGLTFSLSHTDGLVICAVARDADIGVDVERIRSDLDPLELAPFCFAADETRELRACGNEQRIRFFELWTLKEAYLKALGDGLSRPLDSFSFAFGGRSTLDFSPPRPHDAAGWQFALCDVAGDYRLALAVRCRTAGIPAIVIHDGGARVQPLRQFPTSNPAKVRIVPVDRTLWTSRP